MTDLTLFGASPFDSIRREDEHGEYWSARDLMSVMGYTNWREFKDAIGRATITASNTGADVASLFGNAPKKVTAGRPAEDFRLARYAAYLVAMNGDPRKEEIAQAQQYFAIKTRQAETGKQPAELTRAEILRMALDSEERRLELEATVAEQAPLVAQAEAHRAGFRSIARQEFAREVVQWAHRDHGLKVLHRQVFAFLAHIGLFVRGERSDQGHATTDAVRRGLAETSKGTSKGGYNFATGKLTPEGQAYAWNRIYRHIEKHGSLELSLASTETDARALRAVPAPEEAQHAG
jgi:hypothetical protein